MLQSRHTDEHDNEEPVTLTTTALTTAERRALRQIQTAGGRFAVIAADHGQPLVDMLDALGVSSAPEEQRAFKADLVDTVGRDASAVLLDPDVSLPAIVDADVLPRDVGLLVRIEADGHELRDGLRRSGLIDGLGAEGARALGATAAKVMVFLRADREDLDGYTAGLVRAALEDCARADLLCVIELMTYRLGDESPEAFAARKEDLVVEGAVFLQECGSKVLKLEYPGGAHACRRVTDAIDVPWAVLSAGVDHEAFCDQLRASMSGGADGFIAGRSLWKEAVGRPTAERRAFLDGVARRRMEDLLAIVEAAG
jgi:tagatose 1,6-diphosphate aldolase